MILYWITLIYDLTLFEMAMFQEFDTRWDEVLLSMPKIPSDDILESLYKLRKSESAQLKTVLEQKLQTMVKRSTDQKLRLRNRHGRIETRAVVKNRKGLGGVEGGTGTCYQWKEKRPVFARRPMQFQSRCPRSCKKTRTHCRHAF